MLHIKKFLAILTVVLLSDMASAQVADTIYLRQDGTTNYWPQLFRTDNHKFSPGALGTGTAGSGKVLNGNRTWVDMPLGLPSLSGNSGKILSTNGSVPTWIFNWYTNTATTTSGVATFYLTNDKTSTGTALWSNVLGVIPIINDSNANYTYSWSYNSTTKALTVTAKTNGTAVVSLITVLTAPVNVTNGTTVGVFVVGN